LASGDSVRALGTSLVNMLAARTTRSPTLAMADSGCAP